MFVRCQYEFSPSFSATLAHNGINGLDAFFTFAQGDVVSKPGKRVVRRFALSDQGKVKTYYVKQAPYEGIRTVLRRVRKGEGWHSGLHREYLIIQMYIACSLPVMHVVGWGEKKILGIPVGAFLIVEDVGGVVFHEAYNRADAKDKKKMLHAFGEITGLTHKAGINSIARVQDVYCVSNDFKHAQEALVLIDREHGLSREVVMGQESRGKQLAKVLVKALPFLGMPRKNCLGAFLLGYAKGAELREEELMAYCTVIKEMAASEAARKKHDFAQSLLHWDM